MSTILSALMGASAAQSNYQSPTGSGPQYQSVNTAGALNTAIQNAIGGQAQGDAALGQQNQLAAALQNLAAGKGPDPALAQLQQTTQANNAQAAGLAASARGSNPALAARNAEYQAGANNQAAAGQAAIQSAQQQLGATSQLGNVLSGIRGQDINQQQANTSLANTVGGIEQGQNNTQTQLQQLAQETAAQNAGLQTQVNEANASAGSNLLGAVTGLAGTGIAAGAVGGNGGNGGATGGDAGGDAGGASGANPNAGAINSFGVSPLTNPGFAKGGTIPRLRRVVLSPGEKVLRPKDAHSPLMGAWTAAHGTMVPGHAKFSGNDSRNDTEPATLPGGSLVLPRTVANNPRLAAAFVRSMNKHHGLDKNGVGLKEAMSAARKSRSMAGREA